MPRNTAHWTKARFLRHALWAIRKSEKQASKDFPALAREFQAIARQCIAIAKTMQPRDPAS